MTYERRSRRARLLEKVLDRALAALIGLVLFAVIANELHVLYR